ncbi:MAG TPA: phosphate acyltransferase PlsX [Rhodothermales bacterium]|nr:phosphate acyltransferase PlsX [Rhodothermales bacterium]
MAFRVAIDAMGGDDAPDVVVEGALEAVRQHDNELEVLLLGPEETVKNAFGPGVSMPNGIQVIDAPDIIEMAESPASAVKTKTNSSIHLGLGLVRQGQADCFVSAGNTGAVMAASAFILGRLPGVPRPAIAGPYPTLKSFCIVVDVGANVDCRPEHLAQFGLMGSIYMNLIHNRDQPRVALMNVGEEPGKGNELTKEAYKLLAEVTGINFVGNIEGRDLMHHAADVVVCDGFVGNIVLKLGESVATVLVEMLKTEVQRLNLTWDERATVARVVGTVQKQFNYEEYGGAPLLGIKGNVLIGHGGSSAKAIHRLIVAGAEMAKQAVSKSIAEAVSAQTAEKPDGVAAPGEQQ